MTCDRPADGVACLLLRELTLWPRYMLLWRFLVSLSEEEELSVVVTNDSLKVTNCFHIPVDEETPVPRTIRDRFAAGAGTGTCMTENTDASKCAV
jgi:hypothetical protein